MKTRDLKSLSNTIASVVDPIDKERAQMLQEGFLNSLTEKARQVASKEMEDEDEEEEEDEEDDMEDEGEEEEEKPSNKKKSKMMKEEEWKSLKKTKVDLNALRQQGYRVVVQHGEGDTLYKIKGKGNKKVTDKLDEMAAPGYEDWASDPKVKASFKKQYGKRWKEVMYGHSWNLAKQEKKVGLSEEELGLEEGYQAKRMRVIRKAAAKKDGQGLKPEVADFMKRSFKKKRRRDETLSGGRGAVGALETRASKKTAAMKAKLAEALQLDEAGYKKLMRVKGAAYKAELAGNDEKRTRLKRAAAELTDKVAAGMARRGGASPEAVKGGGSRIGKSGKYTQKAGKLANQRDKALASFRTKGRIAQLLDKREDQSRKKRERQQAQAKFNMDARHGYFGHELAPEIAKAGMRARYNYEKKYGRLKGK